MPPDAPLGSSSSNIRVFVRWHEQVVFAGEEVKCTITFKNAARVPSSTSSLSTSALPLSKPSSTSTTQFPVLSSSSSVSSPSRAHGLRQPSPLHPGRASSKQLNSINNNSAGLAPPPASARGHRSTLSLSVPSAASRARAGSVSSWSPLPSHGAGAGIGGRAQRGGDGNTGLEGNGNGGGNGGGHARGHGHKRSVSIVSIGSLSTVDDGQSGIGNVGPSSKPQRPARGHARASSLQILPRGGLFGGGPRSATHPKIPASQSSPLFNSSYPPDRSMNGRLPGTATAPDTPRVGFPRASPTSAHDPLAEFKFPRIDSPSSPATPAGQTEEDNLMSPTHSVGIPVRSRDAAVPTINEQGVTPSARVLSTTSIAGTPRSSGEFYSLSNNSSETLASEYVTQQPLRTQVRSPHNRRTSNMSSSSVRLPETLMMGYAQIQGSFTLDGSLIDLAPFEQVKRKAVVGGQGGGVIGLETPKRDSGLLRSFGWGNITNSIGELLGGGELSSIKEMRGIANSKPVPLLSMPQSILFVDLQLGPGESRSFEYTFRLPKGLPPTHRGKAMKISYSLVIGTQRPGGAREQKLKSVEIPFRVLGGVNSHGEILGHDLMSPYILLRDQARVQTIRDPVQQLKANKPPASSTTSSSSSSSFLTYVDDLLARPKDHHPSSSLLSPTTPTNHHPHHHHGHSPLPSPSSSRRPSVHSLTDARASFFAAPPTAKEAIDLAILRSNFTPPGQQAANRFEIARNGRRVAVVMLPRPAYRLGETVTVAVDFSSPPAERGTDGKIQCYAVHAALETAERVVDPGLALRSEASVHRVTRKVWGWGSEVVLYARRAVFNLAVPVAATPEFVTSGVGLEWKVRLEFVVPPVTIGSQHGTGNGNGNGNGNGGGLSGIGERGGGGEGEDEEDGEGDGDKEGEGGVGSGTEGEYRRRASRQVRGQPHPLLEEISRDERGGQVLVAVENLMCESFEVAVPLRVYGAACNGLEKLERDEVMEEGLPV